MSRPSPQVHRGGAPYPPHQQQGRHPQPHPQQYPPPYANRRLDDGTEVSFISPPSPSNRLLLALLSPFRDEISWSLSRLIHASNFHATHLILSEWCGLADRLLAFVDRFNQAARGREGWRWDEEEAAGDDWDASDEEEESNGVVARPRAPFDPRRNEEDAFILNAAASASLILRNASETEQNAQWISKLQDITRITHEMLSLPEDLYGFEENATSLPTGQEREDNMRLEGVREMQLYWAEIAQMLAPRIKVFRRADVVRYGDGSVDRLGVPGAANDAQGEDEDNGEVIRPRLHSSDRLYAHMVLLLHTTSDRALLLASLRFLANLIGGSRSTKQEIFVEQPIERGTKQGSSPGIVARCRELLPLCDLDETLAETLMDCLGATVDVVVEKANPKASLSSDQAAAGVLGLEVDDSEPELRREWPNALELISGATATASASTSKRTVMSQPIAPTLTRMLSYNTSSWDRKTNMTLAPSHHHALKYIPNRATFERDIVSRSDRTRVDAKQRWKRLREMKAEAGLVEYTSAGEKLRLARLEEPGRVREWLRLVTKSASLPEGVAGGGRGRDTSNDSYITQMQIWTSYRDTFEPIVNSTSRSRGTPPFPPLMAAADVISSVTATMQGTQAVLRPEEDARIGGQKFVITGLEGNLRPEVRRWNCLWRGCPSPGTDSKEARWEHIVAHSRHAREGRCCWAGCEYRLPSGVAGGDGHGEMMARHVRTHLADEEQPKGTVGEGEQGEDGAAASLANQQNAGRQMALTFSATSTTDDPTSHLEPDGIHARSAKNPSRGTLDRPSSINYKVYRTPFDPARNEAHGPAANAARMLLAASKMCRSVLGEEDGEDEEEDEGSDSGEDSGEGEGGEVGGKRRRKGGKKGGRKVKLDFTDRAKQARFGMPFVLPKGFQATVAAAVAQQAQELADAHTDETMGHVTMTEGGAATTTSDTAATAAGAPPQAATSSAASSLRASAQLTLQELIAIDDQLLRWAGCNDILAKDLLETLDNIACTKGARKGGGVGGGGGKKRRERERRGQGQVVGR